MEHVIAARLEEDEQSLERQGRRDVELLLGTNTAFKYCQVLDKRGHRRKPEVFKVEYVSKDALMPEGFGWWPMSMSEAYNGLPNEEQWIEAPAVGEAVALKKRLIGYDIAHERAALLQMNQLFSPGSANRPVRLYGFGVGKGDFYGQIEENGYIITELISPGFISYKEYLESRSSLPLDESLAMIAALTEVIATIHQAGIAHGDLEGTGHEEHLYWNPHTRQLRIIDWSHTKFSNAFYDFGIHLDQMGMVEVAQDVLELSGAGEQSEAVIQHMYDDIGREYPSIYPETPEGTSQLVQDLHVLKESLIQ